MIKQTLKQIFISVITGLCIANIIIWPVYAQTAGLLFVSPQQYFDNNGRPLSGGKVYFYQPGTLTFKNIWSDANETTPLANPVILNAAGRPNGAVAIYGEGNYRQIIRDAKGNEIADLVTSSGGSGGGTSATGDGDLVGTIKPWAGLIAPNQYVFAYGQELSRTTYNALFSAITQSILLTCTSGSPILTNVSDTTQIRIGSALELSCVAPGTTVISKTAVSVTLSANSSLSTGATAVFFPFGNGNGSTTFNVPDLRGYAIAGRDNMGGIAAARLTTAYFNPGGTSDPDALGAPGGGQSHVLLTTELAAHTHTSPALTDPGHIHSITDPGHIHAITDPGHSHQALPGQNFVSTTTATGLYNTSTAPIGGSPQASTGSNTTGITINSHSTGITGANSNTTGITLAANTGSTGSGTAFSVVQPSLTLNYIIKITPDRASSISTGVTSLGSMTGDIACGSGLTCTGNIISASGGGSGSPGGANNNVQFNNAGVFGGSANLTWIDPKLTIGATGATGQLALNGTTSGSVIQTVQAAAGTPTITWGTSTGTPVVTASAPLSITTATGNIVITGAAGQILAGATPAFTATPTLGASGTLGSLTFGNATSGLLTLEPVTGALGTVTVSLPAATDTLVGKATTDIFTNKTFDTAATGNSLLINGLAATANTGTGSVVRATSPTLVTPILGVATATSINKVTITQPATGSTLTIADGKTFTSSNTLTFTGTDGTSFAFPSTSDTVVTLGAIQTLTSKTLTSPTINGGTATALTNFGIRSSGSGAFDLTLNNTENLTAGRTLTLTVNNASRTFNVSGNLTLASDFITSGANSLTLTTTGATNVTLPTNGTLATINTSQTFSGTNIFSALTQFTDIKLSSGHIYPTADGTTALQVTKADGTTRIMNFDTTNARIGINKNAGAFDLDVNGAVNVGGVLTFGTLSATSLGASTSTITGLTVNNTPNSANDYFLYYSAADGAIRKCTVGSCTASGVAGVSSLNGLTGALSIAQGPGTIVSSGGSTVTISASNGTPQGRLTLTSNTPVLTSTVSAATTVYYTSYVGRIVPIYDGTNMTMQTICPVNTVGACELSVALGSNWTTNSNWDFFVGVDSGTVRLCTGPAWSSDTARGTGAGTTELAKINGLYSNAVSMTCRYNNTTTFTCSVNQCTYVGTMRTGSAGQTNYTFGGASAGGTAGLFGLWNAYNRVNTNTMVQDTNTSWTVAQSTTQSMDTSTTNRISFVVGLTEDFYKAVVTTDASSAASNNTGVAIGYDSTSSACGSYTTAPTGAIGTVTAVCIQQPLGFHYFQALDRNQHGTGNGTVTGTFAGSSEGLTLNFRN